MKQIGERIRAMRVARSISQAELAERLGVSRSAVAMWEGGSRVPGLDTLEALAGVFGVATGGLLGEDAEAGARRVPVLGSIPAGIPMEAIEDVIDWEELPSHMFAGGKEYFCLQLKGDSMYPEYRNGDVVVFRKQDTCENGQDCAVMVNGDDATFKRVRISGKGVTLQPLNPKYEPLVCGNDDVLGLPVRIIGVAVELRRKF